MLYLIGATAAGTVFDVLNTDVPGVASAVMISPTKTFDQSPAHRVGAVALIAYGTVFVLVGIRAVLRRDIA